jgi:hypothetical protein
MSLCLIRGCIAMMPLSQVLYNTPRPTDKYSPGQIRKARASQAITPCPGQSFVNISIFPQLWFSMTLIDQQTSGSYEFTFERSFTQRSQTCLDLRR